MLLNYLSSTELKLIDNYRRFCPDFNEHTCKQVADIEHILRIWSCQKENLYKLFGEKFIISKNITIEKTKEMLYRDLEKELCCSYEYLNFKSLYIKTVDKLYENSNIDISSFYTSKHLIGLDIIALETLPVWFGKIKYITPSNKEVVIEPGAKIMRVLGKFANTFDITEAYEKFRIKHSQIMNDKYLKGKLCLSIHPLDYMTMSDNNNNWSSCMSWENQGCYRQGTIEMMNSDCVIVAYLESNNEQVCIGSFGEWNSKKWRELFVVHPQTIVGIKGYPYQSNPLEEIIMDWLRDLAAANWNTYYTKTVNYNCDFISNKEFLDDTTNVDNLDLKEIQISFETYNMYNDFGTRDDHPLALNVNYDYNYNLYINYSGVSECIACGNLNIKCKDTECSFGLLCKSCNLAHSDEVEVCRCCGNYIDTEKEEVKWCDYGYTYCTDCWSKVSSQDAIDCEYYYKDDLISLVLVPDLHSKTSLEKCTKIHLKRRRVFETTESYKRETSSYFNFEWNASYTNTWYTYYDANLIETEISNTYYITRDMCTDLGLYLFGINNEKEENMYFDFIKE